MDQNPRSFLHSIFAAKPGFMVFDSAFNIIGLPDIKFAILAALEDIDVICNCFFRSLHYTSGLP